MDVSDSEPDLGWTEASSQGEGHTGGPMDWEVSAAVDLPAARERYFASKMDCDNISSAGTYVQDGDARNTIYRSLLLSP